jgi:hypothetical protein
VLVLLVLWCQRPRWRDQDSNEGRFSPGNRHIVPQTLKKKVQRMQTVPGHGGLYRVGVRVNERAGSAAA